MFHVGDIVIFAVHQHFHFIYSCGGVVFCTSSSHDTAILQWKVEVDDDEEYTWLQFGDGRLFHCV
jgi:hypothetical protein